MSTDPQGKEGQLEKAAEVLGAKALETVPLPKLEAIEPKDGETMPYAPPCITQYPVPRNLMSDPTQLMVGLWNEIPRWKPGSVIKWAAWRQGYDSQDDANYAALQLNAAAEKWNEADIGVKFQWVPLAKDANFVLSHGGDKGGVLASAYFPNGNELNYVFVYTSCFGQGWKENMWRVFSHELGHVLGFRHEFAESEGGAQLFGRMNPLSVMNYRREPPLIQPSDIDSAKRFYQLSNGDFIGSTEIHDYDPA